MLVKVFPMLSENKVPVSGKMEIMCFAIFIWKNLSALLSIVLNNILVVGTTVLLHNGHNTKNTIKNRTCLE